MKAKEFDKKFDDGKDITDQLEKRYSLDQKQFDKTLACLAELENMLEDKIHLLRNVNPDPEFRKTAKEVNKLLEELWNMQTDNCEICLGESGGTLGNENIIDGVTVCDYCHAELEGKTK